MERQGIEHRELVLHRSRQIAAFANMQRLHTQGRHGLERRFGLVGHAQLITTCGLQEHGYGKADFAGPQNGDFFIAGQCGLQVFGRLFLRFLAHVFLLGSWLVMEKCYKQALSK